MSRALTLNHLPLAVALLFANSIQACGEDPAMPRITSVGPNKGGLYVIYLRDKSLKIPPRYIGKDWTMTCASLDTQANLIQARDNGDYFVRFYLIEKAVFSLPKGRAIDLVLKIESYAENGLPVIVDDAHVALVAKLDLEYEAIIESQVFPYGSAFDQILRWREVDSVAYDLPIISSVSAYYDFLDPVLGQVGNPQPSGLEVTVRYLPRPGSPKSGESLCLRIPSGLDPLKLDERSEVSETFVPIDTLAWPERGGNNGSDDLFQ